MLKTSRLILRRYVNEDAAAMYKNWASDSEVTKYLMWQTHSCEAVSQSIINEWLKEYSNDNYYHWAIVLKENGTEPIGDIAVVHINEEVSMMHIGYCIGRDWWHQGITSEAFKAMSVPLLIPTPIVAAVNDGASLIPSPTIITNFLLSIKP